MFDLFCESRSFVRSFFAVFLVHSVGWDPSVLDCPRGEGGGSMGLVVAVVRSVGFSGGRSVILLRVFFRGWFRGVSEEDVVRTKENSRTKE